MRNWRLLGLHKSSVPGVYDHLHWGKVKLFAWGFFSHVSWLEGTPRVCRGKAHEGHMLTHIGPIHVYITKGMAVGQVWPDYGETRVECMAYRIVQR
jgi:hypothetical protein